MPHINVNFQTFLPTMGTTLSYFEIMKAHDFIQDIQIVQNEGNPQIKILRKEDLSLKISR